MRGAFKSFLHLKVVSLVFIMFSGGKQFDLTGFLFFSEDVINTLKKRDNQNDLSASV